MAVKHIIYKLPNQTIQPTFINARGGMGGWSYGTIEEEDLTRLDPESYCIQEISAEESSSLKWYGNVRGYIDNRSNIGSNIVTTEEEYREYIPNEITGSVISFMKKIRKIDVERHYDKKFQLLNVKNFPGEKETWEQQYNEASAYTQNTGSATPLLSLLAQKRGITLGTLAQNVISKRDAYVSASAEILGSQQVERDAIDNLSTIEQVRRYFISGSV
jgi:hypothetical protein